MASGTFGDVSLARWRRRRVYLLVTLLLAASASFATTAIIVSSRHPAPRLGVGSGPSGTSGTGGAGTQLSLGALVPAADLVSDPVFVSSTVGFALETAEHGNLAVERLARSDDGGRT